MKTISIIVCPNGFGHIRRSCQLYNSLTAAGYKVKIYTDKDQFNDYILSKNITNNLGNFSQTNSMKKIIIEFSWDGIVNYFVVIY